MCIRDSNSNGLVMVIRNYHWLNSSSRVLISTCSAPLVQTGQRKQFPLFDCDLWPTTLTQNPRLAKVKDKPHTKSQRQRSNGSNRCPQTNGETDTTKRIIAPATRSIIINSICLSSSITHTVHTRRIHRQPLSAKFAANSPIKQFYKTSYSAEFYFIYYTSAKILVN